MFAPPVMIQHKGSELYVVPAQHFCHVFAGAVYRICSDPATRPEAIAVELGPATAAEARAWLGELGVGTGGLSPLPVMLGLVRRNRMIRPSLRQEAMRLQEETGKDLNEMPSEVLHQRLGFSDHAVLFLSPVDSIIEAIRSSLELGIPAHGVDLEETADGMRLNAAIQDPIMATKDLAGYVAANLAWADATRDPEIDLRREIAMAARLKALMQRHRRVLFTCGMAHWLKIRDFLADDSVQPARPAGDPGQGKGQFKRVVVHPLIAARYMDLFPAIVQAYQKRRIPPGSSYCSAGFSKPVSATTLFRARLRKAYTHYFARAMETDGSAERNRDLESLSVFEGYLQGLSKLCHRPLPDMFMILQAAQETMSGSFVKALIDSLMEFPWTSPEGHPGCPLLMPPKRPARAPGSAVLQGDGDPSGRPVFLRSVPPGVPPVTAAGFAYQWQETKDSRISIDGYTWRPWEYLISSMSFRAIQEGTRWQPRKRTVVFEGSVLDGIDVKSTLRAFSRGKDRIYVQDFTRVAEAKTANPIDGFPVVWILSPGEHPHAQWKVLHEPSRFMEGHVRDPLALRRTVQMLGGKMVAAIGYGHSESVDGRAQGGQDFRVDYFRGILVFQPIFWTNRQFARWAEMTGYRRNPFCRDADLERYSQSDLKQLYENKHRLRLGEYDWVTSLILMALPFSREFLTVVLPGDCRIEPIVHERARKCGVRITTAPLNLFPEPLVSRLAACHLVPAIANEPETEYPEFLEKAIGESPKQNRELVPRAWIEFGAAG